MTTPTTYGFAAVLIHWLMAIVIIGLIAVGMYMEDLPPSPDKFAIYGVHKAIGVLAFVLVLIRLLVRGITPPPPFLESQARWEHVLAYVVHMLLYIGMVILPISGYVMSAAGGHPISFFGLFDLPLLIEKNEDLGKIARGVHGLGGNFLIIAILLHVAGAFKHHLKDKDATMARMVPWLRK